MIGTDAPGGPPSPGDIGNERAELLRQLTDAETSVIQMADSQRAELALIEAQLAAARAALAELHEPVGNARSAAAASLKRMSQFASKAHERNIAALSRRLGSLRESIAETAQTITVAPSYRQPQCATQARVLRSELVKLPTRPSAVWALAATVTLIVGFGIPCATLIADARYTPLLRGPDSPGPCPPDRRSAGRARPAAWVAHRPHSRWKELHRWPSPG